MAEDQESVRERVGKVTSFYKQRGLASRVGFGKRPLVLVVDLINGFTDPESPLGSDMTAVLDATRRILEVARKRSVPVVYTSIAYENPEDDAGLWIIKIPSLELLRFGTRWVEVDERLGRLPGELIVYKFFASSFAGTALQARLQQHGIDTIILCGATTSGCVRATAIDAIQHGYRCIVPYEAVGDRAELPHEVNLMDIDAKYGDCVPTEEVIHYLQSD
jgi:nicotinamidase-related amidase